MNQSVRYRSSVLAGLVFLLMTGGVFAESWPQIISVPQAEVTIYQPQLESFEDNRLTCRAAVEVLPNGAQKPVYGAVWLSGQVETDRDSRMVTFSKVDVPDAKFPAARQENIEKLKSLLLRQIPTWDLEISMDRLLTMLDVAVKQKKTEGQLNHTPPKIIIRKQPTVLVMLDGPERFVKTKTAGVMRVVNTPYKMFYDEGSSTFYLKGGSYWYRSTDTTGQWEQAKVVPRPVQEAGKEGVNPFLDPALQSQTSGPDVIVTTEPTELILIDGMPKPAALTGTGLLYISNTKRDVFKEVHSEVFYLLLSGRWYRAKTLENVQWEHVSPDALPDVFSKIDPDSVKGHVLVSVPGTIQAREAVLNTYIPQTAVISRKDATLKVTYDGKPEFVRVDGGDAEYAVNTEDAVFHVNQTYYCCCDAVWFVSKSPEGRWSICTTVPSVLYTLPPSCPHYAVRYVSVYGATSELVYMGYTPGYRGSYVYEGTVVYGTGYTYRGWFRNAYYPHSCTWGLGMRYHRPTDSWALGIDYSNWLGQGDFDFGYHYADITFDGTGDLNRNLYRRNPNAYRPGQWAKRSEQQEADAKKPTEAQGVENNLYADPAGKVYRRGQNSWQVNTSDGWQEHQSASSKTTVYETPEGQPLPEQGEYDWSNVNLELQYEIRDRGNRRVRDFQRAQPLPSNQPAGGRRR